MWILISSLALGGVNDGHYHSALTSEQIAAQIDVAIETATGQYPSTVRWIVRNRLQPAKDWCWRYEITRDGDDWSHSCDGKTPIRGTIGAPAVEIRPEDPLLMSFLNAEDDAVTARFMRGDSGRQQTFEFHEDHLMLVVTVVSDKLDPPLSWTLRYDRQ
jgi:hypothetical protein